MIYFLTLKGVARNKLDELRRVNITPFEIPIPQNSEYDMMNNLIIRHNEALTVHRRNKKGNT